MVLSLHKDIEKLLEKQIDSRGQALRNQITTDFQETKDYNSREFFLVIRWVAFTARLIFQ